MSTQRSSSVNRARRVKDIGKWELYPEQRLGEGSFATVYLGRTKTSTTPPPPTSSDSTGTAEPPSPSPQSGLVAIKVVRQEKLKPKVVGNVKLEVETLLKIKHPNIVRLFGSKSDPKYLFLVFEYCEGKDLSSFLKGYARGLPEPIAHNFLLQIAHGLKCLHEMNLVHRDLKPQNILLSEKSENATLKIADFGFVRVIDHSTMADTLCGTPLYMAPEMLHSRPYNYKVDLWSLGIILYELLTGKHPFGTPRSQIELIKNFDTVVPVIPSHLPPDCIDLLRGLLVKDPEKRLTYEQFFSHPYIQLSWTAATPNQQSPPAAGDVTTADKVPERSSGIATSTDMKEPDVTPTENNNLATKSTSTETTATFEAELPEHPVPSNIPTSQPPPQQPPQQPQQPQQPQPQSDQLTKPIQATETVSFHTDEHGRGPFPLSNNHHTIVRQPKVNPFKADLHSSIPIPHTVSAQPSVQNSALPPPTAENPPFPTPLASAESGSSEGEFVFVPKPEAQKPAENDPLLTNHFDLTYIDRQTELSHIKFPLKIFDFSNIPMDRCSQEQVEMVNVVESRMQLVWYIVETAELRAKDDVQIAIALYVTALNLLHLSITQIQSMQSTCKRIELCGEWAQDCFSLVFDIVEPLRDQAQQQSRAGQPTHMSSSTLDIIPVEQILLDHALQLGRDAAMAEFLEPSSNHMALYQRSLAILRYLFSMTQNSYDKTTLKQCIYHIQRTMARK